MEHKLVRAIEKALGWRGANGLGAGFALGPMPDATLCSSILTPTKLLDLIMRRSLANPQLRVFQAGKDVHPNDYVDGTRSRRGQHISMANMRRLGRLVESGCTLVLDSVDTFDVTMEVACRALQWWSRELVQVNTYLTTQDASGFNLHWDDHDVIIVQLAGEKEWEVRGLSRVAPMYRDAELNRTSPDDIVWAGTLHTGEVMHIPRGYWHQATRNGRGAGYSLHATFGFVKRTGVDWFTWVADRSRAEEPFRLDLDRSTSDLSELVQQQQRLESGALELIRSHSPTDYLAAREHERPAHRHVATGGAFGPPNEVVCITEFPPALVDKGDEVDVVAAGRNLTFASKALPALRLLLSGNPVTLLDASLTTGVAAGKLADLLIEEGICAELTPELSSGYTDLATSAPCLSQH